jgi:hypothetical protein
MAESRFDVTVASFNMNGHGPGAAIRYLALGQVLALTQVSIFMVQELTKVAVARGPGYQVSYHFNSSMGNLGSNWHVWHDTSSNPPAVFWDAHRFQGTHVHVNITTGELIVCA